MRVWVLTSELVHDVAGGIATYVDAFARLAAAHGHEVTVFGPGATAGEVVVTPRLRLVTTTRRADLARADPGDRRATHPAYPYNVLPEAAALGVDLARVALARARDGGAPDVIEAQDYGGLAYHLLHRRAVERTPLDETAIVVHLHSPDFEIARVNDEPRFRLERYRIGHIEKTAIRDADGLVCPSRYLAERVRTVLGSRLDVAVIPYPLPVPIEGVAAPQPGELLYVGRLEVRKGVLPLVAACDRLWQDGLSFRLTLIGGDDALRARGTTVGTFLRERYAGWIDAGRLVLRGQVDRDGVRAAMRRAWAVVVPSLWENFPNVCLEAAASGALVVVSRDGGHAALVGDAGVRFDWAVAGDAERALRLALGMSDAERTERAEATRTHVAARCAPDIVLDARVRHFEETIRRRTARMTSSVAGTHPSTPEPRPDGKRLVSLAVIGAAVDAADAVAETVASLRAIAYAPIELLVRGSAGVEIDAGSPASDGRYALEHADAVDGAHGDFVLLVDAGTTVDATFVARALEVFRRQDDVGFVFSWTTDRAGAVTPEWDAELPWLLCRDAVPPAVVVRRAAHRASVPADAPDRWDVWLSLVEAGWRGVALPEPLTCVAPRNDRLGEDGERVRFDGVASRHRASYAAWATDVASLLASNGPGFAWGADDADAVAAARRYDEALGGRLMTQLRRSPLVGPILRHETVRRALKRALGL